MTREDALNKTIGILTYHQVNFCKSKEAVANMNEIIEALEKIDQEHCDDAVSRQAAINAAIDGADKWDGGFNREREKCIQEEIEKLPSVTPQPNKWIPCSERLPEDLEPVNITWVNHNPKGYYADIKDKPFTATGHYCKGRWYWYSSTCQDYLEEYGRCDVDEIDTDIEITAWMPLPTPYQSEIPTGAEGSE